jgi:hypothetical protein
VIVDLRGQARGPFDPKKFPLTKSGNITTRKPETVDAVVLHQVASNIGPAADDARRKRRVLAWPYHAVTYDDGDTVLAHSPLLYTYHANALNKRSLGFAVEGHFAAFLGQEKALHAPYTEAQADGARRGLKRLVEDARALGCPVKHVLAHRQSSINRGGDPGEYWFKLLSRFARDELGLETLPMFKVGNGQDIPPKWL